MASVCPIGDGVVVTSIRSASFGTSATLMFGAESAVARAAKSERTAQRMVSALEGRRRRRLAVGRIAWWLSVASVASLWSGFAQRSLNFAIY